MKYSEKIQMRNTDAPRFNNVKVSFFKTHTDLETLLDVSKKEMDIRAQIMRNDGRKVIQHELSWDEITADIVQPTTKFSTTFHELMSVSQVLTAEKGKN